MSMFFPLIATVEHNEDGDDDGCYKWQSPNDCKSEFIGFTCKIKKYNKTKVYFSKLPKIH